MDSDPTPEALKQAAHHLRLGEFVHAGHLLANYLQENPGSADGWVLFSYALEDPVRKLECVERALQLQPEHAHAARRMQELRQQFPDVQTDWARSREAPAGEPQAAEAEPAEPEPVEPEPAQPEPVEPEPVQPEPVEPEPVQPEPVEPEPAQPQPFMPELAEPESVEPAPVEPQPITAEPADSEPFVTEPVRPESQTPPAAAAAEEAGVGASMPPFSVPMREPTAEELASFTARAASPDADEAGLDEGPAEQAEAEAPMPQQVPQQAEREPSKRSGRNSPLVLALAAVFSCALVAGAAGVVFSLLGAPPAQPAANPTWPRPAGTASAATPVVLPPSWTPTATPTITPTRTPEPTSTATFTPTFAPPNPTQLASLANIQLEVSDLRGLGMQGGVEAYLITRLKARAVLEDMYRSAGGSEALLEDEKRELVALGLVKPTYNMIDTVLNGLADAVGGFFDPVTKRLFVIGGSLGALERFVYSHEFAHALVDQHYPFDQLGAYPLCQHDQDRCRAITGLVEGDATLVMQQWLLQFASPQDYLDLLGYTPPAQALPEQFPPPFAVKDSEFPYQHGTAFVQFLHDRGNWAEVNRAYGNLPQSSEQILHPEKYLSGERPQEVHPPPLDEPLGEGWRLLVSDTLGEWGTYLLLGYGADLEAQLADGVALPAAQGWGGDRYQVYYHEADERILLAALWRWDSTPEAVEFHTALQQHLNNRFRGITLDLGAGACWQGIDQLSCSYQRGAGVLWILAPDQGLLEAALGAYAGFP